MRDIKQLHPDLQEKIEEMLCICEKNGYKIGISECLRTVAEQDALYAKGRRGIKDEKKVTNAKGSSYSSMHQWGIAFDIYRNDKKGAYYDKDGFFDKIGELGKSLGLEWGGDWKSIKDKPHFQLPQWGSTPAKLKKEFKTPDNFMATWKKAENKPQTKAQAYPTVRYGSVNEYVGILQDILIRKGYVIGKKDCIFGSKTERALKDWQGRNKDISGKALKPDGICGPKTWESIQR